MKKLLTLTLVLGILSAMAVSANALEYTIDEPVGPNYETPTSVEVIHTSDGGAMKNEDLSKNAALIPPAFGSNAAYALNTGEFLTPNLAPGGMAAVGASINGSSIPIVVPGSAVASYSPYASAKFTDVTSNLYYSAGHLGTLKLPAIGVSVKIFEGTGSSQLAKGAGHFEESSIWDGNVALAGHNRGVNCHFGQIHTLNIGDKIILTTKLGTRTYAVTSVSKVSETDRSSLAETAENCITLYTCVRDQSAYRWCVRAVEVV